MHIELNEYKLESYTGLKEVVFQCFIIVKTPQASTIHRQEELHNAHHEI
jgi:hypothetical protein